MDKELNNIADDIIKDGFGTAAPAPEPVPAPAPSPASTSTKTTSPAQPRVQQSQDPFSAPATPRETFTAEIPRPQTPSQTSNQPAGQPQGTVRPASTTMNRARANEYSRIKEQMSAARETSSVPQVPPSEIAGQSPAPRQGLNKVILLFIILIPVVVVVAGITIALLNQPEATITETSTSATQPTYKDPKETATPIDLSTFTDEIIITEPGYYLLTGSTTFPIKVNAPGEVTLYLQNISVTATDASALSNFSPEHLVIFLEDGTESTLAVTDPGTFDSIYSEGDLTIDGASGILNVTGITIADGHHYDVTGSGIRDSKNVVIEPGENSAYPEGLNTPAEGETELRQEPPADHEDIGPAEE